MHEIAERLAALFFPHRCVLCDTVVEYATLWCGKCPLPSPLDSPIAVEGIDQILIPFAYQGGAQNALLRLKQRPHSEIAGFFAGEMHRLIQNQTPAITIDCIVPVPQSKANLKKRKFNHAQLLAKNLSGLLQRPLCEDALLRLDDSVAQHLLGAKERQTNAEQSYQQVTNAQLPGQNILLVDDICTTGSTGRACAGILRKLGAKSIVLTCAAQSNWSKKDVDLRHVTVEISQKNAYNR